MKTKPQCNMKECLDTAGFHPVVVFKTAAGYIRAIVGLKICLKHKKIIKEPDDILGDGGARIAEALGRSTVVLGKHLDWCTLDSKEARDYATMQEKSAPS